MSGPVPQAIEFRRALGRHAAPPANHTSTSATGNTMTLTSHAMQDQPSVTSAPPVHFAHEMTTFRLETTPKVVISCVRQMEVAGVVKVIEPVEAGENQEVSEASEAAGRAACGQSS
jgi:hypothetical protein